MGCWADKMQTRVWTKPLASDFGFRDYKVDAEGLGFTAQRSVTVYEGFKALGVLGFLGFGFGVWPQWCFEACSVKGAGLGLRGIPIAVVIPNLAAHLANPQLWW